jgi:hypothetical protein
MKKLWVMIVILPAIALQAAERSVKVSQALNSQAVKALMERDIEELQRLFSGHYEGKIPDVNYLQPIVDSKPPMTLLMYAVSRGKLVPVQILLTANPDLEVQDRMGWTALMYAMGGMSPNPSIVQILLKHNAQLNYQDAHGYTPLMRAIQGGNVDIIPLAIFYGADITVKNTRDHDHTALDYAQGNADILDAIHRGQQQRQRIEKRMFSGKTLDDILFEFRDYATVPLPAAKADAPNLHQLYGRMPVQRDMPQPLTTVLAEDTTEIVQKA